MTPRDRGIFLKLFVRSGYVLDFSTSDFDAFTMSSVGEQLCSKYKMSKGKSLCAYMKDADDALALRLLSDMMDYYENSYRDFPKETSESEDNFGITGVEGAYRNVYLECKEILSCNQKVDANIVRAQKIEEEFSTEYMSKQISLMLSSQGNNSVEAIGKAKELVESCCKTILAKQHIELDKKWTLSELTGKTLKHLRLTPSDVDTENPFVDSLKKLLGSLKGMVSPLAEIRNAYGSGHGREVDFKELDSRYSRLVVGASITLVEFIWASYCAQNKERNT